MTTGCLCFILSRHSTVTRANVRLTQVQKLRKFGGQSHHVSYPLSDVFTPRVHTPLDATGDTSVHSTSMTYIDSRSIDVV